MRYKYSIIDHPLIFRQPSGTSRGILREKGSMFIVTYVDAMLRGIGEVSTIAGLSPEVDLDIAELVRRHMRGDRSVYAPAVQFGIEMWQRSLTHDEPMIFHRSSWSQGTRGIPINGLIWMGQKRDMLRQIKDKLDRGFTCIKLKIGAISFEEEIDLIKNIRDEYPPSEIEIRVDANGAFTSQEAMDKLLRLYPLGIHSIEQPIRAGQWEDMAQLCDSTPIDIALDEELIGIDQRSEKERLLEVINPQFIIVKPSLLGGWEASEDWINLAGQRNIGWWVTSALESNVGLQAIASWVATLDTTMPQGLGTGGLFVNNIEAPLYIQNAELWYNPNKSWDFSIIADKSNAL